jgi:DDE superfamily endonuclease
MRTLPTMMIRALAPFAPLFSERVFEHVQVLMAGAILTPGKRTVSSALRAMGLDQRRTFHRYHRVLSRAKWSSMEASRILLDSLVEAFVPEGPLVVGIDETLERRQGKKIAAKGIYRDPVRWLGAPVPAQLLPGVQPHRGGLRQDQGDRTQSLRQDSRGPARGVGRSIVRGQLPGCPGVLRTRRLPSYGSTTMKRAVESD